jgi:DNA-binding MarR family transcriptional regulator
MSITHVGAVLYKMPELRERASAFVLLAIADSADQRSGWSWHITLAALADAARLTRRGVRKCLRDLERRGYIATENRPGHTARYRLLFNDQGQRRPASELYTTGERRSSPKVKRGERRSSPGELGSSPGELGSSLPKNPYKESVLSPSLTRRTLKRMPKEAARDLGAEKARQLEQLRKRLQN